MTIEQTQIPAFTHSKGSVTDDSYATIEEITGITDRHRIKKAISSVQDKTGAFAVEDVIQVLVTEPYLTTQQPCRPVIDNDTTALIGDEKHGHAQQIVEEQSARKDNETANEEKGVIDLTNESAVSKATPSEQDAVQKAIAESLRDTPGILGGQISREEQEISRVLEQSLQDSKVGTKRKRGDIWFVDPQNPHERKRDGVRPVGLKNVGNTCWFSAVIQSLFQLPVFRNLVLNFAPPGGSEKEAVQEKRNLEFMQELRYLFALMVGSKRKYVDPAKAVEILKEAFSNGGVALTSDTGQQDVSEFQHKLLEWLEDAFRDEVALSDEKSKEKEESNPMVQLFYGHFVAEGTHEGSNFTNKEPFGQFPLQVNGFHDIHESLEAGTAQGEIETVSGKASSSKSGQEYWFTKLPPVLTFELSRFQFNQAAGRPEKIHNKLEFPELIYLDRYLECNKCITRRKRLEVKKIKEDLQDLQEKLDRFINYGSGPKRFPLQDVLQYALEFAQSKDNSTAVCPGGPSSSGGVGGHVMPPVCSVPPSSSVLSPSQSSPSDMEVESPNSHISMQSPDVTPTHPSSVPPDVTLITNLPSPVRNLNPRTVAPHLTSTPPPSSRTHPMDCETPVPSPSKVSKLEAPSPKYVSHQELHVLQSCLRRWRTEVEADVRELQDSINTLEDSINTMYLEENLKQVPYRLHAVLVHEGQAASGHYWAYVYHSSSRKWLKCNDIAVTESNWEELTQDSYGGYHNASAYCLMYVDGNRKDLIEEEVDSETGQYEVLPIELQKYLNQDNNAFEREMEEWDNRQQNAQHQLLIQQQSQVTSTGATTAAGASGATTAEPDVQCIGESKACQSTQTAPSPIKVTLAMRAAMLVVRHSFSLITKFTNGERSLKQEEVNQSLKLIISHENKITTDMGSETHVNLPKRDVRLSSLLVYLSANELTLPLVINRILFEQFSLPAAFMEHPVAEKIAIAAQRQIIIQKERFTEKEEHFYKEVHEMYAMYRKVIQQFVVGLEAFHKENFTDAVSLLCSACDLNRTLTKNHNHPMRGLDKKLGSFFRREALLHLNEQLSTEFERGENVEELSQVMVRVLLPALGMLGQEWEGGEDESAVEEIRQRWCGFLSMELPESQNEKLQEFLSRMFDPPPDLTRYGFVSEGQRIRDSELQQHYERVLERLDCNGYLEKAMKES